MLNKEELTFEELGRRNLILYQQKSGFRYGTDTALLAWFTASLVKPGRKIRALELGTNCGAASLLLYGRHPNVFLDGIELQKEPYDVFCYNIGENSLSELITAYNSDIRELPQEIKNTQYDLVFFNPPFFSSELGPETDRNKTPEKFNARFENNGTLDDFIKIAASRIKPSSGYMSLVIRADRISDVITCMRKYGTEPVFVKFVHSFSDRSASMVLVAGRRGTKACRTNVLPPLILNERKDGEVVMTETVRKIYEGEHEDCFI